MEWISRQFCSAQNTTQQPPDTIIGDHQLAVRMRLCGVGTCTQPRGTTPSRRRTCAGIPARPIRLQGFATSRKSPSLFGRAARVPEKPGRSAVLPWRKGTAGLENEAFPCCSDILSQCIVRLVAEFRVTVSVCRRSKVTELSVTEKIYIPHNML